LSESDAMTLSRQVECEDDSPDGPADDHESAAASENDGMDRVRGSPQRHTPVPATSFPLSNERGAVDPSYEAKRAASHELPNCKHDLTRGGGLVAVYGQDLRPSTHLESATDVQHNVTVAQSISQHSAVAESNSSATLPASSDRRGGEGAGSLQGVVAEDERAGDEPLQSDSHFDDAYAVTDRADTALRRTPSLNQQTSRTSAGRQQSAGESMSPMAPSSTDKISPSDLDRPVDETPAGGITSSTNTFDLTVKALIAISENSRRETVNWDSPRHDAQQFGCVIARGTGYDIDLARTQVCSSATASGQPDIVDGDGRGQDKAPETGTGEAFLPDVETQGGKHTTPAVDEQC
jgi:hypothetical protein